MKKVFSLTFLSIFLVFFSLLMADPIMDFSPPKYVEELGEKEFLEEFPNLGSLFLQGERPMFATQRASKVNDILLVEVSEVSSANFNTQKTYTNTSNGNYMAPNLGYLGNDEEIAKAKDEFNDGAAFNLNLGNKNSAFNSAGNQNRSEAVELSMSARIIKVLSNGNYYIEGTRVVLTDGEKKSLLLSGVVRPHDISSLNTVQSKYISEFKLSYTSQGDLSAKRHKKWGSDELEEAWPF